VDTSSTLLTSEHDDIDALKQLVAAKDARIAILEEQLRLAAVKAYAPKSEKLTSLGQFDLFNEAETFASQPAGDAQAADVEVPAHTRERGKRKPIDAATPAHRARYSRRAENLRLRLPADPHR
jgi:transposase